MCVQHMHTAFDPETKDHDTEGNRFLCSFNDTKDLAELKSSACAAQGMVYEPAQCLTVLVI